MEQTTLGGHRPGARRPAADGEMPVNRVNTSVSAPHWSSPPRRQAVLFITPPLLGGGGGERRASQGREYISKYEESPETGHFMDQQEVQMLE